MTVSDTVALFAKMAQSPLPVFLVCTVIVVRPALGNFATDSDHPCEDGWSACFNDCCDRQSFCNAREERCQHCSTRQVYCGNQTMLPRECDLFCFTQSSHNDPSSCNHPELVGAVYWWLTYIFGAILAVVIPLNIGQLVCRLRHRRYKRVPMQTDQELDRPSDSHKTPGEAITSDKNTDNTVSKAEATTEPRGLQHAATTCDTRAKSVMLGAAPLNQSEWAEAPPTPTPRPQPAHDLDEGAQSSVGREPLLREQEEETEEDLRPNETRRYEANSCHHGRGECRDKRLMNVPPSNTDNDHSVAIHTGQVYPGTGGIPYVQAN